MTDFEITVPRNLLSSLLSDKNGVAALLEGVLNQILDAQATEQIGAGRYERSEERAAYRNGYRPRQLYTRVGPLTLRVPQLRDGNAVRSKAAMIATGINKDGYREILGLRIGDSESEAFWQETFRWLKDRGLSEVRYVVSDDHRGLVNAAQRCFQGAIWQRCQVHFMRNVLSHTSSRHRAEMGDGLKRILNSETAEEARQRFNELAQQMEKKAGKAIDCLEQGLEDTLAVLALPSKYRKRLKSSNMLERLNQEIRRRERVIRIFPNEKSAERLMGALLAEAHEDWQGRRYLEMDEFFDWEERRAAADQIKAAANG